MLNDKLAIRAEVETSLEHKPISEVNFCVRMQRLTLFLYKESTVFWTFFPIFMGYFLFFLFIKGPTQSTILLGIIEAILYLPFYYFIIKRIKPFSNREQEVKEIRDKLEVLIDYRDFRLTK